jgi:hypothetical protein
MHLFFKVWWTFPWTLEVEHASFVHGTLQGHEESSRIMREIEVTWCLSMLSMSQIIQRKRVQFEKKGDFDNTNHRCTNLVQIKYTYFRKEYKNLDKLNMLQQVVSRTNLKNKKIIIDILCNKKGQSSCQNNPTKITTVR